MKNTLKRAGLALSVMLGGIFFFVFWVADEALRFAFYYALATLFGVGG